MSKKTALDTKVDDGREQDPQKSPSEVAHDNREVENNSATQDIKNVTSGKSTSGAGGNLNKDIVQK